MFLVSRGTASGAMLREAHAVPYEETPQQISQYSYHIK